MRLLLACLGMVLCSVTEAAELASRAPPSPATLISAIPLRTLSSTRAPIGDYFAWAGQALCDENGRGEYRSHIKVDSSEILVEQFDVFGSGQFLLRGRRPDRLEPRLAILSPGGGLKDVVGWPGLDKPMEEPSLKNQGNLGLDQITRGGDGRIYVAALDAREGEDVVYAFGPSGDRREVFTLRPMAQAPRLLGWKAAGRRFAAAYQRDERAPEASPGEHRGRYWIAVYDNRAGGGDLQPTVYGPAPGPPICYRHEESKDRFTFLQDGKLVTMSAP
jgi:hypothetical protein